TCALPIYQPGDDRQLTEGMAEVAGAAGYLDQSLNLAGGVEQGQEMGKQMTAGHPAERLLALAGPADAIGDGGAAQVAFGDAGRGDTIARRVEHRSEEHTSELQSRENLVCRLL